MNYIKRLESYVRTHQESKDNAEREINDLRTYLLSSKFRCGDELDGYVNIQDVLNRLETIERTIQEGNL